MGRGAGRLTRTAGETISVVRVVPDAIIDPRDDPAWAPSFEDLTRMDRRSTDLLIRSVPLRTLALALKGASEEVRAHYFSHMTSRGQRLLRDEIAWLGPVPRSQVERARARVVQKARELDSRGEVDIPYRGWH